MADFDVDGAPDPQPGDPAPPRDDSGASAETDARADVSAPDADAGGDGGAPRYCASLDPAPAFCEDFDTLPLSEAWRPRATDGGILQMDETIASSPPRSLRVTMFPPEAGETCRSAVYDRKLKLSFASRARVEFDAHLGDGAGAGYPYAGIAMHRAIVGAEDGAGACNYFFLTHPADAQLAIQPPEPAPAVTFELSKDIADATWTRLAIEIERSDDAGGGATVSAWLDGARVLDPVAVPESCRVERVLSVTPGLFCVSSSVPAPVDTRVDNVVVWTDTLP